MRHIILIDPIENLTPSKDSTLMLANALKALGHEVYLLFKEDFYISTTPFELTVNVPEFVIVNRAIESVKTSPINLVLSKGDTVHMRLEPPFDTNYLRSLWMLKYLQSKEVKVINDPSGIMNFQEKLYPFEKKDPIPSCVVATFKQCQSFFESLENQSSFIIKPLDLFQGYGVTKVEKDVFDEQSFLNLKKSFNGLAIVQPFLSQIYDGEIRAIYFNGVEIGSILKRPPGKSILANIAQGASYQKVDLEGSIRKKCEEMSRDLVEAKVPWVAFDILDGKISEANTTCPGLLYEVSKAYDEDLAMKIAEMLT